MTGGADFGGGLMEWQTLQFLVKTAAPSTGAADITAGENPEAIPDTIHTYIIFFITIPPCNIFFAVQDIRRATPDQPDALP
jgi:hypothetical protein